MGILSVMRNVEGVVIVFLIIKERGGVLVLLHCYCAIKQKFIYPESKHNITSLLREIEI